MPASLIAYLFFFQSPSLKFEDHAFHIVAITVSTLACLFVAYVTWRCYRASGEPLLRWMTLGFLGFSLVYALHGAFTGVAHDNIWLFILTSTGRACHGAHVHRGDNAIESLMAALHDIVLLRDAPTTLPESVVAAMVQARQVSEAVGGVGEFDNLSRVTVNIGALHGGTSPNLVPGQAQALLDVRYPPGMTGTAVREWLERTLSRHPKVQLERLGNAATEPNLTDPTEPLVQLVLKHARRIVSPDVVANMRVGLTDSGCFRHRGIPTVVYGPTAYNLGGVDEYVKVREVEQVFDVHLAVVRECVLQDPNDLRVLLLPLL